MTKLTVAALQLAFTDDTDGEHPRGERAGARGGGEGRGGRPAARAVRRPLFLPGRGREPVRDAPADRGASVGASRCRSSPRS